MPRHLTRFVVWSNALYFIPLGAALQAAFWIDALALGVLIVCSTLYHASGERRFVRSDLAASVAVIAINVAACIIGAFKTPYFTYAWLLVAAAFVIRYYFERGDRGSVAHGFWHALAALILTLCVYVYAA